ncbi:hypothetical protein TGPRC2_215055 [Toxoplasma gondii TgCatPRC2]|uniref:Uncharacterized protein n=1 Tax=Toxoplasma gondii TgCatPRC2 TaxID=1130821 RepID=A0A151HFC6_TOXGO|nr:hypothetical protein TGPRC2_215055 [Toxoplasma gondii TgCatPRC2]
MGGTSCGLPFSLFARLWIFLSGLSSPPRMQKTKSRQKLQSSSTRKNARAEQATRPERKKCLVGGACKKGLVVETCDGTLCTFEKCLSPFSAVFLFSLQWFFSFSPADFAILPAPPPPHTISSSGSTGAPGTKRTFSNWKNASRLSKRFFPRPRELRTFLAARAPRLSSVQDARPRRVSHSERAS